MLTREFTFVAASHTPFQPLVSSAQTYSSLYTFRGGTWSRRDEEKKGGKSAKETKCSQTHEQNMSASAGDTWGVLHHINAVQSPPVKGLKKYFCSCVARYWLEIVALDCEEPNGYKESTVLIYLMNIP